MILSVINQKGGVAKTTSTLNIAALIARKDKKVLMIDLDPQASLTISVGIEPNNLDNTIYNVMCEKKNIEDVVLEINKNLYLVPSTIDLSLAELQLVNEMARESILKKALNKIKDDYDYIIIDCPPSLGLLVINSLNASEKIIIPVATDFLSYRGLQLLLDTVEKVKTNLNPKLKVLGIVATMYDKRTIHSKEVLEALEKNYKLIGKIGISVQVKDSILSSKALVDYNKSHPIVKEYRKVAEVILND